MDFNLYEEIKQSLEDAIKFESKELLLGYEHCVNYCEDYSNCVNIIKNEPNCIVKCIHFGALKNKIKEMNNNE